MRQLIWKEYREKRWWFVLLAVYPLADILTHHSYGFLGCGGDGMVFEVAISGLIALLMGLAAYAPELGGGTADYLYAKPVGWKRVLAAKLVVGTAFFVVSALLAATAFRIICPVPYVPFAGPLALATGAGRATLVMFAGYLTGMCCSVVLPGMLGSILTLASASAVFAAGAVLLQRFVGGKLFALGGLYTAVEELAMVAAGLVVIRFGLTLSLGARIRRYAIVFVGILAVGLVGIVVVAGRVDIGPSVHLPTFWSFSPSGKYALSASDPSLDWQRRSQVLRIYRLSDGASARFSVRYFAYYNAGWTASEKFFMVLQEEYMAPCQSVLRLVWLDADGKLRVREVRFPPSTSAFASPSPTRRWLLVSLQTYVPGWSATQTAAARRTFIFDTDTLRTVAELPQGAIGALWRSDSELTYLVNKQHLTLRLK